MFVCSLVSYPGNSLGGWGFVNVRVCVSAGIVFRLNFASRTGHFRVEGAGGLPTGTPAGANSALFKSTGMRD